MLQPTKVIAKRLVATRQALELKAAQVCRDIDCAPNRWAQYESGERRITLAIAVKLCEAYSLTLDWIYRGNKAALPHELHQKLQAAA